MLKEQLQHCCSRRQSVCRHCVYKHLLFISKMHGTFNFLLSSVILILLVSFSSTVAAFCPRDWRISVIDRRPWWTEGRDWQKACHCREIFAKSSSTVYHRQFVRFVLTSEASKMTTNLGIPLLAAVVWIGLAGVLPRTEAHSVWEGNWKLKIGKISFDKIFSCKTVGQSNNSFSFV